MINHTLHHQHTYTFKQSYYVQVLNACTKLIAVSIVTKPCLPKYFQSIAFQ